MKTVIVFSALLAVHSVCFANEDPFTVFETENNAGATSISGFSPKMNRYYHDSLYEKDITVHEFGERFSAAKSSRKLPLEPIHFSHKKWSVKKPTLGIARYELPRLKITGWMVFQTDASGKVVDLYWTHDPDRKRKYSAELAQAGDIVTTLLDVGAEANPIVNAAGIGPIAVLKLVLPAAAKKYGTFSTCAATRDSAQDFGWFAAVNNPIAIAAASPVSLVLGAVAYQVSAQHHNGFWECLPDDLRRL